MAGNGLEECKLFFVKRVFQRDSFVFTIEWVDGKISSFRLSDLQTRCPCAKCCCEKTGKRLTQSIDFNVKARRLYNVGRYGLKVEFTSGCSSGIYSYAFLRKLSCL